MPLVKSLSVFSIGVCAVPRRRARLHEPRREPHGGGVLPVQRDDSAVRGGLGLPRLGGLLCEPDQLGERDSQRYVRLQLHHHERRPALRQPQFVVG